MAQSWVVASLLPTGAWTKDFTFLKLTSSANGAHSSSSFRGPLAGKGDKADNGHPGGPGENHAPSVSFSSIPGPEARGHSPGPPARQCHRLSP